LTLRLRGKFRLFAVLRIAAGGLLPTLVLTFVLAGAAISSPAVGSAILATSSGPYEQAALGETWLLRSAAPHAPESPAECFERPHPCGPGAIPAAYAEPVFLGLTRRASLVSPRGLAPVCARDTGPHATTSLSILFRNFRK
jgi:hypothetical protein